MNPLERLVVEKARDLIHVVSINVEQPFICTERIMRSTGGNVAIPVDIPIGELTLRERKKYKALGYAVYKQDLLNLDESALVDGIIRGAKAIVVWER